MASFSTTTPSIIPPSQPTAPNSFIVSITGQIESCEIRGCDGLHCKYEFVHGTDWSVIEGADQGLSQVGFLNDGDPSCVVWNFPLEIAFKSTNPFGWPQLVVSVYGGDMFNRLVVRGYGTTVVPVATGSRFTTYIPLFTPLPTSMMDVFGAWLSGQRTEFHDTKFIAKSQGRELVRVKSLGSLKVTWNITTRNMNSLGFQMGTVEPSKVVH
eukprot:TRINITY_DN2354_c0_g1_i1.p1 TRINITY_DN2354_c0_g1~~TRINITY_DN2354_c0_g1_i1.p1  ORF type:complete len:211 (+),score=52.66 TRINITY_DN2354_c0_g1_i1:77-709(+)